MTQIERVNLPGIGVGYTLHTRGGQLLGVICRRDSDRELVFYTTTDPDAAELTATLTRDEAHHVAELLHPTALVDHLTDLAEYLKAVVVAGVPVTATSRYHERALGDAIPAGAQVCVIAVIREQSTIIAPEPGFVLTHGDVLAAAGTHHGINQLANHLPGEHPLK